MKNENTKDKGGLSMFYDYYGYYGSPMSRFGNGFALLLAAAVLAVIAGIVLFLTFLNKKHAKG